jgi:hypothetical protein
MPTIREWKKSYIATQLVVLALLFFCDRGFSVQIADSSSLLIPHQNPSETPDNIAPSNPELLFEDTFSELIPGKFWDHSGNTTVSRSSSNQSKGNYSLCFLLDRKASSIPERTELTLRRKIVDFAFGEDYWIGVGIYIPETWEFDSSAEILFQWHGLPDKNLGEGWRNPPLALSTQGNQWKITSRYDKKPLTPYIAPAGYLYSGINQYQIGEISPGEWTNWVFHIKWSYLDDGVLEVWKDSNKVIEQFGGNTFNDENSPYLKFGIYKWDWKRLADPIRSAVYRREVCFSTMRIAGRNGSYDSVSPLSPAGKKE